jgi:hypothetical protein
LTDLLYLWYPVAHVEYLHLWQVQQYDKDDMMKKDTEGYIPANGDYSHAYEWDRWTGSATDRALRTSQFVTADYIYTDHPVRNRILLAIWYIFIWTCIIGTILYQFTK